VRRVLAISLGLLLTAAVSACGGSSGSSGPPPLNVEQHALSSWSAIEAAFTSSTDARCYDELDAAVRDASCKAHWDADAATLARESGAWNTALVNHRVPAKDLDLAHLFKDNLLKLAHTFDDLSISATYGDAASYITAVGDIRATLGHLNDLKNQALADGIDLAGQAPSIGGTTQ
jgi:hypothetical protein